MSAVEEFFDPDPDEEAFGLFISHPWNYNDYDRLVNLLDTTEDFDWYDLSVPRDDPLHTMSDDELEEGLNVQISAADAVLVIAGMYVPRRHWIKMELEIAFDNEVPIIPIRKRGSFQFPIVVDEVAICDPVGWNRSSIVNAIYEFAL